MNKDHRSPFEVDGRIDESLVTGRADVPLVAELFGASGAADILDGAVKKKSRRRGLKILETAEGRPVSIQWVPRRRRSGSCRESADHPPCAFAIPSISLIILAFAGAWPRAWLLKKTKTLSAFSERVRIRGTHSESSSGL